ncbi:CDP-glucose 4,6-dehydratase [Novosphingobium humi]|uniref:CDP-glucose 4,6-dehydratase n=1 Tax=Novosphingobium humi TaxID=2282397 RepID=A0ABY7U3T2_9SPHN|nr:CDP-glucose 4,6-dehydratase [Novosphingobium humi]WCT80148.1 CDP-glucose 4,6-dehydratase [Novosphingobium humi]
MVSRAAPHDPAFWRGRRVLLTGHTGFKGGWLALWLEAMGAEITGLALPAEDPSFFRQALIAEGLTHIEGDIRDQAVVEAAIALAAPEVVFHLAAQPLVRLSYDMPVETFAANVQGTVHVLDACRRAPDLKAIVCVTSDKCYDNREWIWPYREGDPMGGHDPYSASKGAAELVIAAYRRSFFSAPGAPLLASVRAGNVIGGGDWAKNRLVPDIVRALLAGGRPMIRNPRSMRPWQHVLEALGGYLLIAEALARGEAWAATGWNFGPVEEDARPVGWIADRLTHVWGAQGWDRSPDAEGPHEAHMLKLDCSQARTMLGWRPAWGLGEALDRIAAWHKGVAAGEDPRALSLIQLAAYRVAFQAALSPTHRPWPA